MENFLISIIIPVYNTEKYLSKCLDSIVSQTYKNWEAILVDDGSKDESGKICDDYAESDNRFKVIHKKNEGVSIARLTALNNCSGEFVTFVDSDDYITENMLQTMHSYITKYGVDMVVCKHFDVYGERIDCKNGEKRITGFYDKNGIRTLQQTKLIYDYQLGMPPTIEGLARRIIKKDLLQDTLKESVGLWLGEDAICNLFLYEKVNGVYFCEEFLYYYIHREGAATQSNALKFWKGYVQLFERILDLNHDQIYDKQLPGRLLMGVKVSLLNTSSLTYSELNELIQTILNTKYVKKYLLENDHISLQIFKDKFTLFLLKIKRNLFRNLIIKLFQIYKKF